MESDAFDRAAIASSYLKAMSLAESCGMRPLTAHCHRGLGRLHERVGDLATSSEQEQKAIAIYRELGMYAFMEQAQAKRL